MQPLSSPGVFIRAPIICCNQFQGFGIFFFLQPSRKPRAHVDASSLGNTVNWKNFMVEAASLRAGSLIWPVLPPGPSSPRYPQGISALILQPSSLPLPPPRLMPHLDLSTPEGTHLPELSQPLSAKVLPISSDNFAFNYSLRGTQLNLSN